jgi:hypothetical protein
MEMTETMKLAAEMTAEVLPWMQTFHKAFPGQRYLARTVAMIKDRGVVEVAKERLATDSLPGTFGWHREHGGWEYTFEYWVASEKYSVLFTAAEVKYARARMAHGS